MQVLLNLLSNALKFTPTNGDIAIVVRLLNDDGELEMTVRDNGTGIKEADM